MPEIEPKLHCRCLSQLNKTQLFLKIHSVWLMLFNSKFSIFCNLTWTRRIHWTPQALRSNLITSSRGLSKVPRVTRSIDKLSQSLCLWPKCISTCWILKAIHNYFGTWRWNYVENLFLWKKEEKKKNLSREKKQFPKSHKLHFEYNSEWGSQCNQHCIFLPGELFGEEFGPMLLLHLWNPMGNTKLKFI